MDPADERKRFFMAAGRIDDSDDHASKRKNRPDDANQISDDADDRDKIQNRRYDGYDKPHDKEHQALV